MSKCSLVEACQVAGFQMFNNRNVPDRDVRQ